MDGISHTKLARQMAAQLRYVIAYVSDLNEGVAFYRDTLGMSVKFQTPGWTELQTGETTIARFVDANGTE